MSSALVICLDRNKLVEQEHGPPLTHLYEVEAVTCVKSWRENAAWSGNIYAVQYSGREISDGTARRLLDLGTEIVTMDLPPIGRPFMDVVYALAQAEAGVFVKQDRILYSDLDIRMKKSVPEAFLLPGSVMLYVYPQNRVRPEADSPEFVYRMRRGAQNGIPCHNTYFQAFDLGGNFQNTVYKTAFDPLYADFFRDNVYFEQTDDDYFFEEGLYDYVCSVKKTGFNVIDLECPADFFVHEHAHRLTNLGI